MRLLDGETEYNFSPQRYEDEDLGEIDYDVQVLDTHDEIFDAIMDSGSCIEYEDEALQQGYVETFSSVENVHFYGIGEQGYARTVEFSTDKGEALAVDAVKAGESFDPDAYRAAVNGVMRHADAMNKDLVLGGNLVFKHRWNKDLDLTRDEPENVPADELFFDQSIPERELNIDFSERPYDKGEEWANLDTVFAKKL